MFELLGRLAHRGRWIVLAASALLVALAGVWGSGVFGAMSEGGFKNPDSEAGRAAQAIEKHIGRQTADVIVLYTSYDMTVNESQFRKIVTSELEALPDSKVTVLGTYWSTDSPRFVSRDHHSTYAALRLAGGTPSERQKTYQSLEEQLLIDGRSGKPDVTVRRGGAVPLYADINSQTKEDIKRAELFSLPVVLVLLVVIFGGLVAASLPLLVGGLGIVGAFALLHTLALVTDVSVFALNVVTMLGLGLAIDYALFVVSRFREELPRHDTVERALTRTMATAGRTVAVSGVTVAVSLAGLLLFDQMMLRSVGMGGIAVVIVDMVAALTVLPAVLAVLGRRVNALRVPWPRRTRKAGRQGGWARVARSVMRRPAIYAVSVTAVLLTLGAPFLNVQWGGVTAEVLPVGTESRVVSQALDSEFYGGGSTPIRVVVQDYRSDRQLESFADRLDELAHTSRAQVTDTGEGVALVTVVTKGDASSQTARALVQRIRHVPAPQGTHVLVGGQSAHLVGQLDSLADTLPWMLAFIGVVTLVLMFAAFGSLVLPLKAVVMNLLSLTASFGVLVWGFQEGHEPSGLLDFVPSLPGLLSFTPSGTIGPTVPVLVFAAAFGLSMDYEVFLLSRIREEWLRTGDNTTAVATGLQRTGGIITSAALLLIVVVGAFATAGITMIKMIGVGMLVAVLVDATLVRGLLVPATMRLLGRANWWLPGPLRWLHARIELRESDDADDTAPFAEPKHAQPPVTTRTRER